MNEKEYPIPERSEREGGHRARVIWSKTPLFSPKTRDATTQVAMTTKPDFSHLQKSSALHTHPGTGSGWSRDQKV